jgi:hypothetical protein
MINLLPYFKNELIYFVINVIYLLFKNEWSKPGGENVRSARLNKTAEETHPLIVIGPSITQISCVLHSFFMCVIR